VTIDAPESINQKDRGANARLYSSEKRQIGARIEKKKSKGKNT